MKPKMWNTILVGALVLCWGTTAANADPPMLQGSPRSFLRDTIWPVPTADTWRSSAVRAGGLPADVRSDDLQADPIPVGPVPMFGVTYSDDAVFILGGSPFLLEFFTLAQANTLPTSNPNILAELVRDFVGNIAVEPYVAKINPQTLEVETLRLHRGKTPNYPGGIVAHRNGKLYVVVTAVLYEIDPIAFRILRRL
jgi:hypothetical protein